MRAKPKHEILQEFTIALKGLDPMKLKTPNNNEYESEALSILSRFNESGIHLDNVGADDEQKLAVAITKHAFEFWFDEEITDLEPVASELLRIFKEAYTQKPKEKKEVKSVVIG